MNFDQTLKNILDVADFPEDKRGEFVSTFYANFLARLVEEIGEVDEKASASLLASVGDKQNIEEFNKKIEGLSKNPAINEKIEEVSDEVFGTFADDISKYATEEQKQKILAILPQ